MGNVLAIIMEALEKIVENEKKIKNTDTFFDFDYKFNTAMSEHRDVESIQSAHSPA